MGYNNDTLRIEDIEKVFFIKVKHSRKGKGDYCYIGNNSSKFGFEPTVTLKHAKKFGTLNQAKRFLKECAYSDRCIICPGGKKYWVIEEEIPYEDENEQGRNC